MVSLLITFTAGLTATATPFVPVAAAPFTITATMVSLASALTVRFLAVMFAPLPISDSVFALITTTLTEAPTPWPPPAASPPTIPV